MKAQEAIKRIQEHIRVHKIGEYTHVKLKDALDMAIAALREQEERESVWHNAKDSPPKKPGLYYGKRDDTDSMYLCQYRDGVWTLDAYPETRMHVIKWAYYNAFVQEHEERENPKPLTLDELKLMDGEPVWLLPDRKCFIVNNDFQLPYGDRNPCGVDMWGAGTSLSLLARCGVYRSKPKEDAR